MILDPCLMNFQEIDYLGLKSGESVEVETICSIPDPSSQLQMLLFFAFQHPRWQISLAQFKPFSMLTELVYIFLSSLHHLLLT